MIKNNLKHILVDRNISLRQLSILTNIDYTTIYQFANMNRGSVNFALLEKICLTLNVTPGDILTLSK